MMGKAAVSTWWPGDPKLLSLQLEVIIMILQFKEPPAKCAPKLCPPGLESFLLVLVGLHSTLISTLKAQTEETCHDPTTALSHTQAGTGPRSQSSSPWSPRSLEKPFLEQWSHH